MTGVEPTKGKVKVGISVDQVAANVLAEETQFASLELAAESTAVNNLPGPVFKSETVPLPFEHNPRLLFERLLGMGPELTRWHQRSGRPLTEVLWIPLWIGSQS